MNRIVDFHIADYLIGTDYLYIKKYLYVLHIAEYEILLDSMEFDI